MEDLAYQDWTRFSLTQQSDNALVVDGETFSVSVSKYLDAELPSGGMVVVRLKEGSEQKEYCGIEIRRTSEQCIPQQGCLIGQACHDDGWWIVGMSGDG